MGKASRNARNHLTKTFARLQNSGKSIFHIAESAKCDPLAVFIHFSPDEGGRRRNDGFVRHLRDNHAHWTIIAAAQGVSYDEIKRRHASGGRPSGPWLQGVAGAAFWDDEVFDEIAVNSEPQNEQFSGDEDVEEYPEAAGFIKTENTEVLADFSVGQKVRVSEDAYTFRDDLQPFIGAVAIVVHVDEDLILIRKVSENTDENAQFDEYRSVTPAEIAPIVSNVEPQLFDLVLFTKEGCPPKQAQVVTINSSDVRRRYGLSIEEDSSYTFASIDEVEVIPTTFTGVISGERFFFKETGCDAVGIADGDGGVTVLRGAVGRAKTSAKSRENKLSLCFDRLALLEEGKAVIVDETMELREDYHFTSFHRAGSFLIGYNSNGQFWKTSDGKSYSQLKGETTRPEELFGV